MAALDRHLRTTRIVAVGMVAALVVYAAVVELLRTRLTSWPALLPPETVRTLRWAPSTFPAERWDEWTRRVTAAA